MHSNWREKGTLQVILIYQPKKAFQLFNQPSIKLRILKKILITSELSDKASSTKSTEGTNSVVWKDEKKHLLRVWWAFYEKKNQEDWKFQDLIKSNKGFVTLVYVNWMSIFWWPWLKCRI